MSRDSLRPSQEIIAPQSLAALRAHCVLEMQYALQARHLEGLLGDGPSVDDAALVDAATIVNKEAAATGDKWAAEQTVLLLDELDEEPGAKAEAYLLAASAGSVTAVDSLCGQLDAEKRQHCAELAEFDPYDVYDYGARPGFASRGRTLLSALVDACETNAIDPTAWVGRFAATPEEYWHTVFQHRLRQAGKDGPDAVYYRQYLDADIAALFDGSYDDAFVYHQAHLALQYARDPALLARAATRFMELAVIAPSTPAVLTKLIHTARLLIDRPGAADPQHITWVTAEIAARREQLAGDITGAAYAEIALADITWQADLQAYQGADVDEIINATHQRAAQLAAELQVYSNNLALYPPHIAWGISNAPSKVFADMSVWYAKRGDYDAARVCITAIGNGQVCVSALKDCLALTQHRWDIAVLRPENMYISLHPQLATVLAGADARMLGDVTELCQAARHVAQSIANTAGRQPADADDARCYLYEQLEEIYEMIVGVDNAAALPLAQELFAVTSQVPVQSDYADFILAPLWRAGNQEAVQYAYEQVRTIADPSERVEDTARLIRRIDGVLKSAA